MMRKLIYKLLIFLRVAKRPAFMGARVSQQPSQNELGQGDLAIVQAGGVEKWACFNCPGGCGEKVMLPLSPKRRPNWSVKLDDLDRPTLTPSVRQINECSCHFWIKAGEVVWCADSGHMDKSCEA